MYFAILIGTKEAKTVKTKTWIALLGAMLLLCGGLSLWLLGASGVSRQAQVWSEGELLYTLNLQIDRTITVETDSGINVITVKGGKIGVTEADCPDGYCMDRGMCSGGTQIVCLPNRLVIRFVDEDLVDGVVG